MPRAPTRDEQAIPVPELAVRLNLAVPAAQAACDYLVSRGLLRAAVYAVEAPIGAKHQSAAIRPETDVADPLGGR